MRGIGWLAGLFILAVLTNAAALAQTPGQTPGHAPAQSPGEWHTMTGPDRTFTAELPTAPKYTATQMKTGTGASYTMHQYMAEVGDIAYVVQTAIYPSDVDTTKPRANLQTALDNAARNMDGSKWASIDWPARQNLTAYDAVGVRKGFAIRSFSTMKGRQIITLTYAGPAGSAAFPDADRFVGSLRMGQ
jgi:hypothetical protein